MNLCKTAHKIEGGLKGRVEKSAYNYIFRWYEMLKIPQRRMLGIGPRNWSGFWARWTKPNAEQSQEKTLRVELNLPTGQSP